MLGFSLKVYDPRIIALRTNTDRATRYLNGRVIHEISSLTSNNEERHVAEYEDSDSFTRTRDSSCLVCSAQYLYVFVIRSIDDNV